MRLLIILAFLSTFNSVQSQISIIFDWCSTPIDNMGGGLYSTDVIANGMFDLGFQIQNNTGSDQEILITRKRIIHPPTWSSDYLYWSNSFTGLNSNYDLPEFDVQIFTTPDTISIANNEYLDVEVFFETSGSGSSSDYAHYKYYVSLDGINFLDSMEIICGINALSEFELAKFISLEPNPSSGQFTINLSETNSANFIVTNQIGKILISDKLQSGINPMRMEYLGSGIYYIQVYIEEFGWGTTRVVIN